MFMAFRFPFLVTRLKNHLETSKIHFSMDAILTLKLTIATFVFAHWVSCFWAIIYKPDGFYTAVMSAYYWCLTTMTTVGFGDITPISVEGR